MNIYWFAKTVNNNYKRKAKYRNPLNSLLPELQYWIRHAEPFQGERPGFQSKVILPDGENHFYSIGLQGNLLLFSYWSVIQGHFLISILGSVIRVSLIGQFLFICNKFIFACHPEGTFPVSLEISGYFKIAAAIQEALQVYVL